MTIATCDEKETLPRGRCAVVRGDEKTVLDDVAKSAKSLRPALKLCPGEMRNGLRKCFVVGWFAACTARAAAE
jgi:hypothetical protein